MKTAYLPFLAVACLASGVACAAPRSIADCEKIDSPLAYNQCLTQFSPARAHRGKSSGPSAYMPEDADSAPRRPGRRAGPRSVPERHGAVMQKNGGRIRAVFDLDLPATRRKRH